MEIYNIPEYLIIHLKRFKESEGYSRYSAWGGGGGREKDN